MALTEKSYRKRIMDDMLSVHLNSVGAICVEGPKGCGKTWFSLNVANSAIMMGDSTNNFNNRSLVSINVTNAFQGEQPHLIDEWQIIPMIWDATKDMVDKQNKFGCYILTGSSTPIKKGKYHSGTGRIGTFRLRTMTLYESGDSCGKVSLMDLFENNVQPTACDFARLDDIIYLTMRGGWPALIGKKLETVKPFLKDYIGTLIEDASTLDNGQSDRKKTLRILKSLARNESQTAKLSRIISDSVEDPNDGSAEFSLDVAVSEMTVKKYLDAFDRLFLIEDQYAYSPNVKSEIRVGKIPKRHLADPSLSIAALGLSEERLKSHLSLFGSFFEALCERDLDVYIKSNEGELFHYRDNDGREIDAIVELPDGRWGAIEIKLGSDEEIEKAACNLKDIVGYWKKKGLETEPSFLCVIYGVGNLIYRRDDGVYVVPITALKP